MTTKTETTTTATPNDSMATAAAINLAIALLPLVNTGVQQFIGWIAALRSTAQQAGEWTPQQEDAYRVALLSKTGDPAYLPDVHL